MPNENFEFLGKNSVKLLAKELFTKANLRIDERIIQDVDASSNDKHVASAATLKALLDILNTADTDLDNRVDTTDINLTKQGEKLVELSGIDSDRDNKLIETESSMDDLSDIINAATHLTIQLVEGPIASVTDPKADVIYLQRDDKNDSTWNMYFFTASNGWVNIGDTEIDLSGYWTRDDLDEIRDIISPHNVESIDDVTIEDIVNASFEAHAVDLRDEPEIVSVEIPESVDYGTKLSSVPITGKAMYNGREVPGTFTWKTTDAEFDQMVEEAINK